MKNLFFLTLCLVVNSAWSVSHISLPSQKSVMVYIKLKKVQSIGRWQKQLDSSENNFKKYLKTTVENLKYNAFRTDNFYLLKRNNQIDFTLVSLAAKRKLAPIDYLLRIDMNTSLDQSKIDALKLLKMKLRKYAKHFSISLTNNYQFINFGDPKKSDIPMGFINLWQKDRTHTENQTYWHDQHGPLVQKTGLPDVIRSYTQIHTDLKAPYISNIFDTKYMGMSFETISGRWKFIKHFLSTKSTRELNKLLVKDEDNFTRPPVFIIFKYVDL